MLLSLTSLNNLSVHQMDVKTAFLNVDLDAEAYMEQLKRFVMPGNEKSMQIS